MNEQQIVEIYTDGACSGNPGPGGWGAVLKYNAHTKTIKGSEQNTTNNRMEIMAAIMALQSLKKPCNVKIHTDSSYLQKGIMEWVHKWQKNNWKTANKKPVKNYDLWQNLLQLTKNHSIEWIWVRGHDGNEGNEMADKLANEAIKKSN